MTAINELKIIEYTSTLLYKKNTKKIWVSMRIHPEKEFLGCWQCPGGNMEPTDMSARYAATREIFEETGIRAKTEELEYRMTKYYYQGNEWRIVHCYRLKTKETPKLTEPQEMLDWKLRPREKVLQDPMIHSLKDLLTENLPEKETKIIIIEGSCGAGKTTFAKRCKEYLERQGKTVEAMNESFITQDPERRMIKYGENLEEFRNGKISTEQMREIALIHEKWI